MKKPLLFLTVVGVGVLTVGAGVSRAVLPGVIDPADGNRGSSQVSVKFNAGDRVQTIDHLNVRDVAGGVSIEVVSPGVKGEIAGGPAWVSGYWWWKINYDNGIMGWSAENWLTKTDEVVRGDDDGNSPPVFSRDSFVSPVSVGVGGRNWWRVQAVDPEGGDITYVVEWGDGTSDTYALMSGVGKPAYHVFDSAGKYTIKVTATDAGGASAARYLTVNVVGSDSLAESTKFQAGDRVKTADYLNVRTAPNGIWIRTMTPGTEGEVIGGPVWSIVGGWWWKIRYDNGVTGWSAEDWLEKVVVVGVTNQPPVIVDFPSELPTVSTGKGFQISFRATDADEAAEGNFLNYTVDWGDGSVSDGQAHSTRGPWSSTPLKSYSQPGVYTITLTVTDSGGLTDVAEVMVTVTDQVAGDNQPPVITDRSLLSPTVSGPNIKNWWLLEAVDPEGGDLMYTVSWGDSTTDTYTAVSGVGQGAYHKYFRPGTYFITFTATDREGLTDTKSLTVTVPGDAGPITPSVTLVSPNGGEVFREGELITVRWGSSGLDPSARGAVALVDSSTSNTKTVLASIQNTGSASFEADAFGGYHDNYRVGVIFSVPEEDEISDVSDAPFSIVADDGTVNQPPVIMSFSGPSSLGVGEGGSWNVSVSDPDGESFTYNVDWGDGSIGGGSSMPGIISYIYGQAGSYTITLTVTDEGGLTDTKSLAVTVTDSTTGDNQPPVIANSSLLSPTVSGLNVRNWWRLQASDPEGGNLVYSVDWGDGTSHTFPLYQSGFAVSAKHIYTQPGTYVITFTATDDEGLTDTKSLTVTVPGSGAFRSSAGSYYASVFDSIQGQINQIYNQLQVLRRQLK